MITEKDYPYTAMDGSCKYSSKKHTTEEVFSFKDVKVDSPSQLKACVDKKPCSVAIEADKTVFQFYKSGIITSSQCGTNLDHGVLAVGYGTDLASATDYWIVKNSWGANWGDHGYVKIERNSGQHFGVCGILEAPSSCTMI